MRSTKNKRLITALRAGKTITTEDGLKIQAVLGRKPRYEFRPGDILFASKDSYSTACEHDHGKVYAFEGYTPYSHQVICSRTDSGLSYFNSFDCVIVKVVDA